MLECHKRITNTCNGHRHCPRPARVVTHYSYPKNMHITHNCVRGIRSKIMRYQTVYIKQLYTAYAI